MLEDAIPGVSGAAAWSTTTIRTIFYAAKDPTTLRTQNIPPRAGYSGGRGCGSVQEDDPTYRAFVYKSNPGNILLPALLHP